MRKYLWATALLMGGLGVGLMLAGCSGVGAPPAEARGTTVQALATNQLSAVTLVRSWLRVLYPTEGGKCSTQFQKETLPDGTQHLWGTDSNCNAFDQRTSPDGSGTYQVFLADGRVITSQWTNAVKVGNTYSVDMVDTTADGVRLEYHLTIAFGVPGTPQTLEGSATLADGRRMTFTWTRVGSVADTVSLLLPDGTGLEFRVPLKVVYGHVFWPIFAQGATGRFTAPSGAVLNLTITGEEDHWTQWALQAGDGATATFSLGDDFSGSGQLLKGDVLLGLLRWTDGGTGNLDLVSGGSEEITPSAAARDFQIDRWISDVAQMGPCPMY